MTIFPPMLREFSGAQKREYCDCELADLAVLASVSVESISDFKGMLKPFRRHFYDGLDSRGWNLGFQFGDFPRMGRARAAVTIDATKTIACQDCGHKHRILVEMCTDNRQAILGNLLKLEFAGRKFKDSYSNGVPCAVGIFITDSRKQTLVNQGFVDNSIGTLEEYEAQASGPWAGLLTNSLVALAI